MPHTRASSRRDHLHWAAPSLLWLAPSFLLPQPAVAQDGCASCHAALVKTANVHAPTEDCSTCHESVATPHPEAGKKTFKLTQPVPELCATCHDAFGKSVVHAPVKEGSCTTCHDPHGSERAKLLTAAPKELCTACHAEVAETKYPHGPVSAGDCLLCHDPHQSEGKALLVRQGDALCAGCHLDAQGFSKAKSVHAALEAGCTSCHSPHGAANPKLLRKTESETCLGCHKAVLPKTATVLHGPVRDGQCTPCHVPHGGEHAKLLVAEFPSQPYVPYTTTQFALCFSCHDRALVRDPETSGATGFRDGKKNLHTLHVNNEQKGRSCKMCHEVHGGPNPNLIASSVPFGKWSLPLNFVKTGGGGSCAPGCHRPYSYDRENPGRKLEVPGPTRKRN